MRKQGSLKVFWEEKSGRCLYLHLVNGPLQGPFLLITWSMLGQHSLRDVKIFNGFDNVFKIRLQCEAIATYEEMLRSSIRPTATSMNALTSHCGRIWPWVIRTRSILVVECGLFFVVA